MQPGCRVQITNSFNASVSSCPRKPEQLRLKWENLKKAARKRNTRIRMNNIKTGGGKPDYIPPDELDKVAAILGVICEGYTVHFGGDTEVVEDQILIVPFPSGEGAEKELKDDSAIEKIPTPKSSDLPGTPKRDYNKFFLNSNKSKGRQRSQKLANDDVEARINRNKSISEYYSTKKKLAEKLEIKTDLEIEILKVQKIKLLNEQ